MRRGYNGVMRNVMNGGDRVFVQCIRDRFADGVEVHFLTGRNVPTWRAIKLNYRAECGRSRIAIEAKRQFRTANLEGNFSRLYGVQRGCSRLRSLRPVSGVTAICDARFDHLSCFGCVFRAM
ncbi:hypothetical protein XI03_37790 [Bradyrhizobium sp. CCBAU 65884]|nr:hypothetical protein [Bradyrhizobium sp. CCBAU 65884]